MYDQYDLYDLARIAGWGPYDLCDLGHVFWVESVLYVQILHNPSQR